MNEIWRIEMFGSLRVQGSERQPHSDDQTAITRFRTQKTAALLAYLAFFPRPHAREFLIEALWPDSGVETGRNNLRLALSSLRRQLEPPGVLGGSVIKADRHCVELNRALVTTDVIEFEAALHAAGSAPPGERIVHLQRAVDLYQDRLLTGFYESWIPLEEERLEAAFFEALDALTADLERSGDRAKALAYLERGLRLDPQRPHTRQAFERLSAAPPPPESTQTSDNLPLKNRPDSLSPPAGARLPVALTRFYGRRDKLAQLHHLLSDDIVRLVTLTGVGGCGKTRLAVEAARAFYGNSTHSTTPATRVEFVPLADLSDALLIPTAIFEVLARHYNLGLPSAGTPLVEQIVAVLATSPTLLVLDNLEHLAHEGAPFIQTLLERAPGLTILATSRQRLNLPGEREVQVPPLSVPASTDDAASSLEPAALMRYESVSLFVDRAQSVRADFQVTAGSAAPIAQLVNLLEGVPLALELAAARTGVLSPLQIVRHLQSGTSEPAAGSRLDLSNQRRGTPERQRSLRATIAWSYDLLPPDLQRLFARLAVFRGGFTCQTVEEVCEEPQAPHMLAQLRGASLVVFANDTAKESAVPRFRLLEMLREFAADQLSPNETARLHQRHADYFLELAGATTGLFDSGEIGVQLDALQAETDNFRAALTWLLREDPGQALRLATALIPLWEMRGYFSEGRRWLESALQAGSEAPGRAQAIRGAGYLAFMECDLPAARALLEKSIKLSRQLGDTATLNKALQNLSQLLINIADYAAALACSEECLALNRSTGDRAGIAEALLSLGIVHVGSGEFAAAEEPLQESLLIFRHLGDQRNMSKALDTMAFAAAGSGDLACARRYWSESLALGREVGDPHLIAKTLCVLGNLSREAGELSTARAQLSESLALTLRLKTQWIVPYFLEYFAYLALAEGTAGRAAQILGASEALRERLGVPLLPVTLAEYEQQITLLHEKLNQHSYEAAWNFGRGLPLDSAILLADSGCGDGSPAPVKTFDTT